MRPPCKPLIALVTVVATTLAGCRISTNERVILRYDPQKIVVQNARYNGQYRLYAATRRSPTTQTATPLIDERLTKGETFGFTRDSAGILVAVIRGQTRPIPDQVVAIWTLQADPGQLDRERTALLIVTVVMVTALTVGIVGVATNPWR